MYHLRFKFDYSYNFDFFFYQIEKNVKKFETNNKKNLFLCNRLQSVIKCPGINLCSS